MVEGTRQPEVRPNDAGSVSRSVKRVCWAVDATARVTPCTTHTFRGVIRSVRADLGLSWLAMAGQGTPATTLLNRCGVSYRLHNYLPDQRTDSYGAEAAAALGLSPQRVFKTLITELDGRLMVAVVPVSAQLDLRALAAVLGAKKAKMAAAPDAERASGYVIGGIAPLGHRKQLPVVIDISVRQFDTVFCSAGRRGLQLELAPDELVRATKATVAPIATTSGAFPK
jgi:Cys-tRNA(Pro)/Cys-tRNA(Cys) deacylase